MRAQPFNFATPAYSALLEQVASDHILPSSRWLVSCEESIQSSLQTLVSAGMARTDDARHPATRNTSTTTRATALFLAGPLTMVEAFPVSETLLHARASFWLFASSLRFASLHLQLHCRLVAALQKV